MRDPERRLRWFHYCAEDGKAAQAELDELAAQGWELEELGLFCARFRRAAGGAARCWVEPVRWNGIRRKAEERRGEFLRLCGEAGWDLLEEAGGLWYFKARPGSDPAPIQTDGALEWEAVWKKALWDRGFGLLWPALYWGVYFLAKVAWSGLHPWELLLRGSAVAGTLLLLVWMLSCILRGGHVLRYRAQCRGAARAGEPFPASRRWRARLRGCQGALDLAFVAAILLVFLLGAGEERRIDGPRGLARYETGTSLLSHTEYRRFGEADWLYVDDYDCCSVRLAERVCGDLAEDEGEEEKLELELHWHSPTVPRRAALGFDEAWRYDAGERGGLILREGTRVVRIEAAGTDFTDTQTLEALRAWLEREG